MKKKISCIICVFALILGLAGCGNAKTIEYDREVLQNACEQVFSIISMGNIQPDQVSEMSEWNQGYLMAQLESQTGVQMEPEAFVSALEGWKAANEECGNYIAHGDYMFSESATGVTVSTEAQFENRSASLDFTFDKDMKLDAFTVGAHFSKGEIMQQAGLNTLLGMGTVFVVLIFLSFIISLFKYVPALLRKEEKKSVVPEKMEEAVKEEKTEVSPEDDTELIAVIAAAIAAVEGTSTDDFVVRSIKRRKSNRWNA